MHACLVLGITMKGVGFTVLYNAIAFSKESFVRATGPSRTSRVLQGIVTMAARELARLDVFGKRAVVW